MRLSLVDFAGQMGVSDRMVSKWEGGGRDIVPRLVNQAALDQLLDQADPAVCGRFVALLEEEHSAETPAALTEPVAQTATAERIRHKRDGKLMTQVAGGIFLSGAESEPVWLDTFFIDVFPTTNADFARFCAATGHPTPRHWEGGRCSRSLYDHPVVWVTWADAQAYAQWAGKCLPTAQQWEKAARGTSGAIYPWGDAPTTAKCNVRETGIQTTTQVSRYHSGVSPYGVYDLVGNVWEWCATETTTGRRELKGSAFTSPLFRAAPSTYNDADITMDDDDTGFRCVATPEQMA